MADAPTPAAPAPKGQSDFRVTDVHEDTAFLELDDGRHIAVKIKEGLEGIKRGTHVAIASDGLNKDGTPKDAVAVRIIPK